VAQIQPFRGIRFSLPDSDLPKFLAPPYDVISKEMQGELLARDPRNIVRVVLNPAQGEGAYTEAAAHYAALKESGTLREDPEPVHYLLEQAFAGPRGTLTRFGLMTRFRAENPETGVVLPHEKTRKGPREDRYRVLEATRANFSPIFLMFEDGGAFLPLARTIASRAPLATYQDDDGVAHRLFAVSDREEKAAFEAMIGRGKAYIADGHHRYATALRYRDAHGPAGAWTFGYFTPLAGDGLVVLPYHRLLGGATLAALRPRLGGAFVLSEEASRAALERRLAASTATHAFAFFDRQGGILAESTPALLDLLPADAAPSLRVLDTYVFHQAVLGRLLSHDEGAVEYFHSEPEIDVALGATGGVGVLLRATTVGQIVAVSEARESMPPKSSFFAPKLPSALVVHPLAG
jgi:uncharacterized protein (DUF1015 family)